MVGIILGGYFMCFLLALAVVMYEKFLYTKFDAKRLVVVSLAVMTPVSLAVLVPLALLGIVCAFVYFAVQCGKYLWAIW